MIAEATSRPHDDMGARVRDAVARSASAQKLPREEREELARNLEATLAFLRDAGAPASAMRLVGAQDVGDAAGAAAKTTEKMVRAVNFPEFVKGLIQGVFQSIVESSVQQMQEYAKFLGSVVKSVNQFAEDEVHPEEARDYVAGRFPKAVQKGRAADGGSKLELKPDLDDKDLPDFQSIFGLSETPDLSDEEGERKLMEAGRLEMAKQRQQLLATMVLLGINRIIVTDGEISASVMIDVHSKEASLDASDSGSGTNTNDQSSEYAYKYDRNKSFWGTSHGGSGSGSNRTTTTVSTEHSSSRSSDTAELEARAKLTGNVRVKFRSETFPLERMASPMELAGMQQKAQK